MESLSETTKVYIIFLTVGLGLVASRQILNTEVTHKNICFLS